MILGKVFFMSVAFSFLFLVVLGIYSVHIPVEYIVCKIQIRM